MTVAPACPPAEPPDFKHKLLALTWPLIAIAALMLSVCVASLSTLSSIRAFVNGEGMWSKAERQAIAELHRFADSGSPDDYLRQVMVSDPVPGWALLRTDFRQ